MARLVVAERGAVIRVRDGGLVVVTRDGRVTVAPLDLEQVVVASRAVRVTAAAVSWLAERGVDLVFVDGRGDVVARLYPPHVNRTVAARLAQCRLAASSFGLRVAREMVASKVFNQAQVLRRLARLRGEEWLRDEASRVDGLVYELESMRPEHLARERIRSVEAEAARLYWRGVAAVLPGELGFTGRRPRGGDVFNTALSYGYAILYGVVERALVYAGLDPYMGVLHADKSGRPSLVYDVSDMFKPVAVDYAMVASLGKLRLSMEKGMLSVESRRAVAGAVLEGLERRLRCRGCRRPMRIRDAVVEHSWRLARCFREKEEYRGYRVYL